MIHELVAWLTIFIDSIDLNTFREVGMSCKQVSTRYLVQLWSRSRRVFGRFAKCVHREH